MEELNQVKNDFFNAIDDMLGKSKIEVKGFGLIEVRFERDEAGNLRMKPVKGSVDLKAWRKDKSQLPPWILPHDCKDPEEWNRLFKRALEEK